jgi:hypothetical protein
MATNVDNASLHHAVLNHIVERGFAPDSTALASTLGANVAEVESGLDALANDHGLVLHPNSHRIWVAHPFALTPTTFVVRSRGRRWWGNCAWCSLGVAALLGGDVTIETRLGGEGEARTVRIEGGELIDDDLLVHFPVPMTHAWDNVVYSCSVMHLFDSEGAIDAWCRDHAIPRGDVRPIGTIWAFSQVWYGRHLDHDWRKWTVDEARSIFDRFGLDGPVWALPSGEGRF